MKTMFDRRRSLASLVIAIALLATWIVPATAQALDPGWPGLNPGNGPVGPVAPPSGGPTLQAWQGEYYDNRGLAGMPKVIRSDAAIAFDWGLGSPDARIPVDNFSVRWTGAFPFEGGRYRFTAETDDGVRLYVDGQLLIDQWRDQALTSCSADSELSAGLHTLRMEYYEATGKAVARLTWARVEEPIPVGSGWLGEYFPNRWLQGTPVTTRNDSEISFDWGKGSPGGGVPADNFSVRWTRTVSFEGGRYRFATVTDDGVRLYVDGKLVIDRWTDMSRTSLSATLDVSDGAHLLVMEYYEATGDAVAKLTWQELPPYVGNIVTCVRPSNSWIKVYRLDGDTWVDLNPSGWGARDAWGYLKLDGLSVDFGRYGWTGHPYRVELWANGTLIRSVGNTSAGQAEFRVRPYADNYTPWRCPAP